MRLAMWQATDTLEAERRITKARTDRSDVQHKRHVETVVRECAKACRNRHIDLGAIRLRERMEANLCRAALHGWVAGTVQWYGYWIHIF